MSIYNYAKLIGRIREKGLTQESLAKNVGLSVCSLNLTLNNKREFRQEEIFRVCEILSIPVSQIPEFFFCHKSLEN